MRAQHAAAAIVVAALWGASFVVVRLGLDHFPPLLMAVLRFMVSALAVFFLPRPAVSWGRLTAIAMTLFVGEFGFLFSGMARGMPPGLASIAIQTQAFFTLIIVAAASGAAPTKRQIAGTIAGFGGLLLIGTTVGGDVTAIGLLLTLAAALSWAAGNVLLKGAGKVDMLAMVAWLSIIPPAPLLTLSFLIEGPEAVGTAVAEIDLAATAAVLYLAVPGTLVAFGIWGKLLKLYPAQTVAPFSLLVPVFGILSASIVFGESLGSVRLSGMVLIISGLVIVTFHKVPSFKLRSAAP